MEDCMVSGQELHEKLERTLTQVGVDYRRVISEFGQVLASENRRSGTRFMLRDHVRGLILSFLSNQRPWGQIAKNLEVISRIFFDYDPSQVADTDPNVFVGKLCEIDCGNRAIKKQMFALRQNISTLKRIKNEHGSVDAFMTSRSPHEIAESLSKPGDYKLRQIGYALALEYLRNVGIEAIKPDLHIRRVLSGERLGFLDHYPSEEEAYHVLMDLSRHAGCNPVYLDNLLWLFCAQDYAGICGSTPKCGECEFQNVCNYPKPEMPTDPISAGQERFGDKISWEEVGTEDKDN